MNDWWHLAFAILITLNSIMLMYDGYQISVISSVLAPNACSRYDLYAHAIPAILYVDVKQNRVGIMDEQEHILSIVNVTTHYPDVIKSYPLFNSEYLQDYTFSHSSLYFGPYYWSNETNARYDYGLFFLTIRSSTYIRYFPCGA
jgi:hypothetical protein